MAVRKHVRARDGATVYYAIFKGPDGMQRVRKARTVKADAPKREHDRARVAAQKAAQDARAQVENGSWVDPKAAPSMPFGTLVRKFLRDYRTRSGSIAYYKQRAAVWLAFFGERKAADGITVRDVDRFRRARLRAASGETVRKDLTTLSTLFRWAKARGLATANPADPDLVKRPPKSRPNPCPLSPDQEFALLEAAVPWLRPVVELAIETGADRGELIALNWDRHVRTAQRLIVLPRAKTGVPRSIPYEANGRIRRILRGLSEVRHVSGAVFLRDDGSPVTVEAAKTAMRDAWGAAFPCRCQDRQRPHPARSGCPTRPPKPWKSLRATFATRKAEAGVDVPSIAALMGLTTSHVLEHYVKPSGRHLVAAMADQTSSSGSVLTHVNSRGS